MTFLMNNSLDKFVEDGFCDLGNIIDDSEWDWDSISDLRQQSDF